MNTGWPSGRPFLFQGITMNTEACQHITDCGLAQPLALLHLGRSGLYACPGCAVDIVEAQLEDGVSPRMISKRLSFAHCEHSADGACWPCVSALRAELVTRWTRLHFTDRTRSNRLQRLGTQLTRDHGNVEIIKPAPEQSPAQRSELARRRRNWRTRQDQIAAGEFRVMSLVHCEVPDGARLGRWG
jgi:hypothetical protein